MNFIIWNTRGANIPTLKCHCAALVKAHNTMVVLLETKMVDHVNSTEMLGFDSHLESSADGRKGGIVIIWKESVFKL